MSNYCSLYFPSLHFLFYFTFIYKVLDFYYLYLRSTQTYLRIFMVYYPADTFQIYQKTILRSFFCDKLCYGFKPKQVSLNKSFTVLKRFLSLALFKCIHSRTAHIHTCIHSTLHELWGKKVITLCCPQPIRVLVTQKVQSLMEFPREDKIAAHL